MREINFKYVTKLTFDDYVHNHSFALRVIPISNSVQEISSFDIKISPYIEINKSVDSFGNTVISGYIAENHRFLDFEINGKAKIDVSNHRDDFMPCYLYQSEYTKPDDELRKFYEKCKNRCSEAEVSKRVEFFCTELYREINYMKNVTTTKSTAADAFKLRSGVCQDFSHILISLLRMDGIAARYIAGLAFCDGETHSWVEYWNEGHWEGIDPANNCKVNDDYLILSQGRDFGDCAVDRGVMFGNYTKQLQLVRTLMT